MSLDAEIPTRESLTALEQRAFAALPRERVPGADLEARIVRALTDQGLLGRTPAAPNTTRTRSHARRAARWSGAAIAALLVFTAGIVVGRRSAEAGEVPVRTASKVTVADSVQLGLMVQRAGSEYVNSLQRVASAPDSGGARVSVGREAARSTLHAAARQFARVAPDDPVAALILERIHPAEDHAAQRLWF
jgi:hypothetical protein